MARRPERTKLSDENIDVIIGILEDFINILKNTKDNKSSFSMACKQNGFNCMKVRWHLLNIHKCKLGSETAEPLESFVDNEMDKYEKLYSEIFGTSEAIEVRATLPYDYVETIKYVLKNAALTDNELKVINFRFGFETDENGLTYAAIGELLGVSKECANQIFLKAMRKLRYPAINRILVKGISRHMVESGNSEKEHYDDLAQHEIECLQTKILNLEARIEALKQSNTSTTLYDRTALEKDIDVLNLSFRSYGALKRIGIHTIEDVLNLEKQELFKVRNLGIKSALDIQNTLEEYLQANLDMSLLDYHCIVHKDKMKKFYIIEEDKINY